MQKKLLLLYILFLLFGLNQSMAQSIIPMDTFTLGPALFYQEGKSSYYANKFHGRRTASGQKYSKNKLTAAHRTIPLGTRIKVTNRKSGKWVIVTVNDRGPYARRYILDLSYRAAKHLGMTQGKGYANVIIEELPAKDPNWPQKHVPEPEGQGLHE
ncbi:MAG: septal ring lytic transglycosylase RlpA family protein [bacterium]|nr:septal ring lytic transglycosylase RlpA family protein [bacterium]